MRDIRPECLVDKILPSNVGHQTSTLFELAFATTHLHGSTYNNKNRLLADDTKVGHRVDNAQKSVHGLGLLANHGLVDRQGELVVIKVLLHLSAVDVVDVQVHNSKAATPSLVAVCELGVGSVKDAIEEREVVLDLLVTLDMETVLSLGDGSFKV